MIVGSELIVLLGLVVLVSVGIGMVISWNISKYFTNDLRDDVEIMNSNDVMFVYDYRFNRPGPKEYRFQPGGCAPVHKILRELIRINNLDIEYVRENHKLVEKSARGEK